MPRVRTFLYRTSLLALILSGVFLARYLWPVPAATRAAWVADLERLETHTAAAYANLGDRLASRKLAPRELDARARQALAGARSLGEARVALVSFVEAFDDHHFVASAAYSAPRRWLRRLLDKDRKRDAGPIPWSASGEEACARLGVRDRRFGKIDWTALAGFSPLAGDAVSHPFPAGIVLQGVGGSGEPLAVLRIGLFSQQGFPELCAAEWDRLHLASFAEDHCDDACQEAFWDGLEERLLDRFADELGELARSGAKALLVDLTDNGGGSGIVGRMMRIVTARQLPERAAGFIRHPHSVKRLTSIAADYAAEALRPELPARQRELYSQMQRRVEAAARDAATPCDLSGMWQLASAAELPCANVGRAEPWLDPAEQAELDALEALEPGAAAAAKPVRPAAWTGELVVLTNRWTASASEDFAASLQDAAAARIAGATTLGVGCGYTDGGVTLELPATGLTVRAPDCIRYRRDGRNEAEGVLPDLPVAWTDGDSGKVRAEKVLAALAR